MRAVLRTILLVARAGLIGGRGGERSHARTLGDKVEAIEDQDLVPRGHKATSECSLRAVTCIARRDGAELGVRAEDEVDGGGAPLDLARVACATLVHMLSRFGCLPLRAHAEQVHEEVVGQRLGAGGEDAVWG